MEKQALRTLTVLSLLTLAAVSAHAQAAGGIRMDVPFDFSAGAQQLPAGEYTFRRDSGTGATVLRVENRHSHASARVVTSRVQRHAALEGAQVVFRKYGKQYFLAQVWAGGGDAGRELAESSRERTLRRELAEGAKKGRAARGASKAETVVLTARQK